MHSSPPVILAFDTSAAYCAAAIMVGARIEVVAVEEMTRGQAERLMPMMEEMLGQSGKTWRDVHAIGVGVGPGNFTGIRVSVSAARGLALGLGVPAIGVTGFDARAFAEPEGTRIAIPAPRDQIYLAGPPPRLVDRTDVPDAKLNTPPDRQIEAIARIALARMANDPPPPAPVYVRAADAAPARDAPPVLLDP
ncbi:MAG: tRNA (adenosine(37)-N6)-threonylcarbamoyltransferase complex dimerization subunit type 1 TsaB [Pseudomonadota bacterium]